MSKELKPCPFCGGKAKLHKPLYEWYFVRCEQCLIRTNEYLESTKAIAIWNRRCSNDT